MRGRSSPDLPRSGTGFRERPIGLLSSMREPMWRRLRYLILRRKKDFAIPIRRHCSALCRSTASSRSSGSQPYGKEFLSGCPYASRCELADGTCGKEVEYTSSRRHGEMPEKPRKEGNGRYEAGGESALFFDMTTETDRFLNNLSMTLTSTDRLGLIAPSGFGKRHSARFWRDMRSRTAVKCFWTESRFQTGRGTARCR